MDLGLTNASAVVVGGSRGMGFASARCLADEGARVAVVGRSPADVDRAVEDSAKRGSPDAVGMVADAGDAAQIDSLFGVLRQRWDGELNALINTVGPNVQGSFEALTDALWHQAVDAGVLSMVHCVRSALPLLRKAQWARIVNSSAGSTQRLERRGPARLHRSQGDGDQRLEEPVPVARPEEILVNVISPGSVASDSLMAWGSTVGVDDGDHYKLMDAITEHFGYPAHLPRAGLPEEIGPVVAFLASRRNSYMTGANVNVDGGTDFT